MTKIAVKRTIPQCFSRDERPVNNEIETLLYIHNKGGHKRLPPMVSTIKNSESLASPPAAPGKKNIDWSRVVVDLLEALKWLHDHHIVHRDVGWDKIFMHNDCAVLIDLGASVHIDPLSMRVYEGVISVVPAH